MTLFYRSLRFPSTTLPARLRSFPLQDVIECRIHHRQKIFRPRALVLGIETSCDDTGIAVVNEHGNIIAEKLATQNEIHAQWGGVVPRLAQEAHQQSINHLLHSVFEKVDPVALNAIAVTVGPGLSLCLKVGIEKAVELSSQYQLPLIPVHHMEAHALIGRMQYSVSYPFLCLLISGGHNLLLIVHGIGLYTQIGTTLDDSLGEAYDKVARMLDIELRPSGGAALEQLAKNGDPDAYPFKLPMQKYTNCDFSYSGLKTSVRMTIEKQFHEQTIPSQHKADLAASFQKVAIDHLCDKVIRGLQWARDHIPNLSQHFVVSGGVASNAYAKDRLHKSVASYGLELLAPASRLCTDNGVMVAWTGMERFQQGFIDGDPVEMLSEGEWIDIRARWPLTDRRAFPSESRRVLKRRRLHPSLTTLTESGVPSLTRLSREMPDICRTVEMDLSQ